MEPNLILGATTVLAMCVGIWGLVLRKNGNGQHIEPEPPRPLENVPDWQLERDVAMKDLVERLDYLPMRMEQAFRHSLETQPREPEVPPEWAARMLGDLEHIHEQLHGERPELAKVAVSLERLTDRLEAFMQLAPPPAPEIPRVDDLIAQIEALVDVGRRAQAKAETTAKDAPAKETEVRPTQPSPMMAPPKPRESRPIQRAAAPVLLEEFNTVEVDQDTVYELVPPESDLFRANVMNIGPGWLYMRSNDEPSVGDPHSTMLPPGAIDNQVRVPGRLYVMATDDGMITVRLVI